MKSKKLSENILKLIKSEGFKYINLDTVIETNHIVERSGESFRRFIFSFNDQKGNEICLRPDLTIASCLKYLNEKNKTSKKVFYSGQAFRKTQKISDSIIRNQIGFEIIGSNKEKDDDKKITKQFLNSYELAIYNLEIKNINLTNTNRPIAGDKCWVINCEIKDTCNFWLSFEKDDISSLKSISLSKPNQKPSIIESFLIDEKRITLKLIISRVLQRLNGQKLIGVN